MNHLPEGASFSRLPTLVPFTFHAHFPSRRGSLFTRSANIYSCINSAHLRLASDQVLFSDHMLGSLNTLFPAPRPLHLRFLSLEQIPHPLFAASLYSRQNNHSRTVIDRIWGTALFVSSSHLDAEINTTRDDDTVNTGYANWTHCSMSSAA